MNPNRARSLSDLIAHVSNPQKVAEKAAEAEKAAAAKVEADKAAATKAAAEKAAAVKAAAEKAAADGGTGHAKQEPRGEAADGHDRRYDHEQGETQDTGKSAGRVQYDQDLIKTAAQKELLEVHGILVPDAKVAAVTLEALQAQEATKAAAAEQAKKAEIDALGSSIYDAMTKRATAMQLAFGEIDLQTAAKTAAALGADLNAIVTSAREMVKNASPDGSGAATGHDVFFAGQLGSAARSVSESQRAAGDGTATEEYHVEGERGTRGPVQGPDENTTKMVDSATIPGNPGLNHSQRVDQGKGLGG